MFDSQERRRFQKPNILRRRTKAPVRHSVVSDVSSSIESLTARSNVSAPLQGTIINEFQLQPITKFACVKPLQSIQKDLIQNNILYGPIEPINPKQSIQNVENDGGLLVNIASYNEDNPGQPSVNVESFFNNGENRENVMVFTINASKEIPSLVIIDDESHKDDLPVLPTTDLITNIMPVPAVSKPTVKEQVKEQIPTPTTVVSPQQLFENTTLAPIKFKCDFPDCKKQFRSEKKYKKHKNSHNRSDGLRVPRQVTVECPAKRIDSDGNEQSCGQIYLVRGQLAKHLKQDHTPEDAAFRCEQCGRHFFWESGLRAHVRSHAQSPRPRARVTQTLACGWPGCGRVFTMPCRLREHARAHTGDKPYSCRFPNCNSSFRSASKLERHARRHTGLRRHACAHCGRAFLRREHLRDHVARLHAPTNTKHVIHCPHEQCEMFDEADTLEDHMNSTHTTEEELTEPPAEPETGDAMLKDNLDYIFLVEESNGVQETEEKGEDGEDDEIEDISEDVAEAELDPSQCRSARTHCPWPLAPHYQPAHAHFVLEEDNTVEQPEGSESNIYTVRSDLFLHGNVLINEDSVQMGSAVENAEVATETSAPNDELGLGLLEHPHIDLMQEEMMFTTWQ